MITDQDHAVPAKFVADNCGAALPQPWMGSGEGGTAPMRLDQLVLAAVEDARRALSY
ncbi:hypothetical protein [Actinoplanes sp. NPDC049316]|uniref:hypothetical protein n=1 Tax=Actinoplanes sp. NPDC049316 TaxID=3154727 RepID=UPI0034256903